MKVKNIYAQKLPVFWTLTESQHTLINELASSPHLWARMEDEGLYAPTPKCFKSYLPLKQKLLTHKPSDRTPMCVSIPFLFLIIVNLWRYLCFSLCILLRIFLRTLIKLYIYNLHKISMLCKLMLVESMLIKETNERWYVGVDDRICHQKSVIKGKICQQIYE